MIRVSNIRLPLDTDFNQLERICTKKLGIKPGQLKSVKLAKLSVDARKKSDVHFSVSLDITASNEDKLLKIIKNAVPAEAYSYEIPYADIECERPVIIGFGPAGMFSALVLALYGDRPQIF